MTMHYDFKSIEKKWQDIWEENKTFETSNDFTKEKFYALVEFPYPSGAGLHVGHPRSYTALDIVSRKRRMDGQNVLYPMGWDAFGLPTENFAIKNKIHPSIVTKNNIARFKEQLKSLGLSFDWSREINTTDPEYYKWTQWIFLKMFENGLAYKKEMAVNWCTSCKCVLANEEVVGGGCERCSAPVIQKDKNQWMLAITKYADRLIDDLDDPEINYIDRVKVGQKNWIGRSKGAEVTFKTTAGDDLVVYTTRPDTLFGATYMVIAPEHPFVDKWDLENKEEALKYRTDSGAKSEFERTELVKDKTGVKLLGVMGINPVNGKEIPIFVSDYVMMNYGTGAIMAVPAHDTRDWEFAKKFDLPIIEVVAGGDVQNEAFTDTQKGILVNSDFLNGLEVAQAKEAMSKFLTEKVLGKEKVNFKLRDWVFSRQRYWGEPIPVVSCKCCGLVGLNEKDLPLTLPELSDFEQTEDGNSPLARCTEWLETTCPKCGGPATRETDTMPQWAGSSWYYLRYIDPTNTEEIASKEALEYFNQVDWYNGGMEHTTLHLLYSRFWHKFLFDIGVVSTKEPYKKRTSHGMILGEGSEKMSKSRGNVVNPDEIVAEYGADTLRLYEMFIGDFEKAATWSSKSIVGCKRFLDRIWAMFDKIEGGKEYSETNMCIMHKTIKKVTEDIENLKFNTAIATLMALINDLSSHGVNKAEYETLLRLLSPFAPHIAEELWQKCGNKTILSLEKFPSYDQEKTIDSMVVVAVQINGKVKTTIKMPVDSEQDFALQTAKSDEKIKNALVGNDIVKEIVIKNRIVNIVVKPAK